MIEFLKYLKGYVRIKVWGFSPERFMNLCSNKNILLWDIKKEGDIYYMSISLRGFYKLKPIVKKTGTKAVILKRCGLPFLVPKVLSRKIFILGLAACVFFWYWSGRYVWDIQIEGNYSITEDIFMDFLEQQNIHVGMPRGQLDIETLEKEIRRQFKEVTWTSAKLEGTLLSIQIKENDAPILPEIPKEAVGSDLYANISGTVVSMIVRNGIPQVAIGDQVSAGDLLVSGSIPILGEDGLAYKYQYADSDADIMVETTLDYSDNILKNYQEKIYTGREKKDYFFLLNQKEYCLSNHEHYFRYQDTVTEKQKFRLINNLYLPLIYGKKTHREYYISESTYSKEEAALILEKNCENFLASLEEKGVQIIEKNVKIESSSTRWFLNGTITMISPCGESVEIERMPTTQEPMVPEENTE